MQKLLLGRIHDTLKIEALQICRLGEKTPLFHTPLRLFPPTFMALEMMTAKVVWSFKGCMSHFYPASRAILSKVGAFDPI